MDEHDSLHPDDVLPDNASYIRLLWIHAGEQHGDICCTISTWKLDDAPEFRAISYAWGPPVPEAHIHIRTVTHTAALENPSLVSTKRQQVRENARYALWQARHHYAGSYLWIDSLCINQTNLEEKSAQVAMMARIYAQAHEVLVCIGPSDQSSDYVDRASKDPDSVIQSADDWSPYAPNETLETLKDRWRPPCGEEATLELIEHWNYFCEREYFRRLWVLQELSSGLGRLAPLCGLSIMNWNNIEELNFRLQCWFLHPFRGSVTSRNVTVSSNMQRLLTMIEIPLYDENIYLRSILLDLMWFECADVRDRIYGILDLVDWKQAGMKTPIPDYDASPFDLALRLLPQHGTANIEIPSFLANVLGLHLPTQREELTSRMQAVQTMTNPKAIDPVCWITNISGICLVE